MNDFIDPLAYFSPIVGIVEVDGPNRTTGEPVEWAAEMLPSYLVKLDAGVANNSLGITSAQTTEPPVNKT